VTISALTLPEGVILAKDETAARAEEFIRSNVLPFLKLKLVLTNKRVAGQKANTFLGVIPVGTEKVSYPLANIASVYTSTKISVIALLLGLLFAIGGVLALSQGAGALVTIAIGLLFLVNCYSAVIAIQNNAGSTIKHRISIFNKGLADSFCEEVNTVIAGR